MISRLIGGFVAIILGVALIGPVSSEVNTAAGPCSTAAYPVFESGVCSNGTVEFNTTTLAPLYSSAQWGSTVLKLVPGFFALGILGIGIAVTYGSLRDAGVV
jgi:hypothetical protein